MCSFRNLAKTNPHPQDRVQLFDEEFGAKALMNVGAARRALRQAKPRAVTLSLWPPIHCQNGASHPLIAPSRSYHSKSVALVTDLFALFWQISIIIFSYQNHSHSQHYRRFHHGFASFWQISSSFFLHIVPHTWSDERKHANAAKEIYFCVYEMKFQAADASEKKGKKYSKRKKYLMKIWVFGYFRVQQPALYQ